jgi:hypothetical protein
MPTSIASALQPSDPRAVWLAEQAVFAAKNHSAAAFAICERVPARGDPRLQPAPRAGDSRLLVGDELQALAAIFVADERSGGTGERFDAIFFDTFLPGNKGNSVSCLLPGLALERRPRKIELPRLSAGPRNPTAELLRHLACVELAQRLLQPGGEVFVGRPALPESLCDARILDLTLDGRCALAAARRGPRWVAVTGSPVAAAQLRRGLIVQADGPFVCERVCDDAAATAPAKSGGRTRRPATSRAQSASHGTLKLRLTPDSDGRDRQRMLRIELTGLDWKYPADIGGLSATTLARLQHYAREAPLLLLDDWSIDADFDGAAFQPGWTASRGPDRCVPLFAEMMAPASAASPVIVVRAHDLLGRSFEARLSSASPSSPARRR